MSEELYHILATLSVLLNFAAIIQSSILGYKLYRQSSPLQKANRLLALLLLAFSVIILNSVIIFTGYAELLYPYQDYSNACILIIAPSIYLYIAWLTRYKTPHSKQLLHYIPFLLYFFSIFVFQLLGRTQHPLFEQLHHVMFVVFHVQIISYITLSFILTKRYKTQLINTLSNIDSVLYKWLNNILYGFLIIYILVVLSIVHEALIGPVSPLIRLNFVLIWSFQIIYLSSKSLKINSLAPVTLERKPKMIIKPSESQALLTKARNLLESEGLFTDPNLTLSDLSSQIGTSSRYLSAAINRETSGSFFDFINGYRIKLVVERMGDADYNHLSLLGIASECGFQSSSTFNSAFKKHMGMRPSEYRRQLSVP